VSKKMTRLTAALVAAAVAVAASPAAAFAEVIWGS